MNSHVQSWGSSRHFSMRNNELSLWLSNLIVLISCRSRGGHFSSYFVLQQCPPDRNCWCLFLQKRHIDPGTHAHTQNLCNLLVSCGTVFGLMLCCCSAHSALQQHYAILRCINLQCQEFDIFSMPFIASCIFDRYKHELRKEDKENLNNLMQKQRHYLVSHPCFCN